MLNKIQPHDELLAGESVLVIDVGTGGVKCLLLGLRGNVLFKRTTSLPFRFDGGAAEFDANKAWRDICVMAREASHRSAKARSRIVAVTSTSMREGNVFYDGDGKELLAVPNIDSRATSEANEISARMGELVYEKSGHWPNALFLASRLKWISNKGNERLKSVRKASMVNDWVVFKLTGRLLTEPTNGCETALFDIRRRVWSDEVARELGIGEDIFPDVVECGSLAGNLTKAASEKTSLPTSVVVTVGAADTEAALAGCGAFDVGRVAAVAGTTTPIQAVADSPVTDAKQRTWTCCHVVPGRWLVESNAGATGMLFDWWSRTARLNYGELDRRASKLSPGSNGVRVLIGSALFNAKAFPPLQTRIENIGPWTDPTEVARALIEGTCFAVRANLGQVGEVLHESFQEIGFCGGSAKSDLWSQVQADVLNMKLARHRVGDATAKGAAMLSFVTLKRFGDILEASKKMMEDPMIVEPSAGDASAYESLYKLWLSDVIPADRGITA